MPNGGKRRLTAAASIATSWLALACLLGLFLAPAAIAKERPPKVRAGKVRLALPVHGRAALLVPVNYPIQLSGRRLDLTVSIRRPGHEAIRSWTLHPRANSGKPRLPERRRGFTFVHQIDLSRQLTRWVRNGWQPRVVVDASAALDVNGDGRAESRSSDREARRLSPAHAGHRLCATVPMLRTKPGRRLAVPLPRCVSKVRWHVTRRAHHGRARIAADELIYRPAANFRGTDSIRLSGGSWVQIKVGASEGVSVRAMGDSVTAGFGYYDNASLMPITRLSSCEPGERFYDDACSSNSANRSNEGKTVNYAPDYGLSNNVSWAAQWANEYGVTNYENLAVSGSEPSNWAPGGQLYSTTQRIESEDPDYILMTVGANPLLSEMLFGVDNMGCAVESDILGGYRECIEEAFEKAHLRANLKSLYSELVAKTNATIFLMQYHLSIPFSALAYSASQIAMMGVLLNETIKSVAAEVSANRLQVIAPPHFNVGIDISPVYPSNYSCSHLGFQVDGPSVQADPTQDELEVDHPLSFCSGPEEGPPWVISGDTGIHPSAAGYAQMASRVPAPR
ncbi:MAG: GDSL-type esterase/lipase family protein [Solirubrobacterales bacterium]